MTPPYGKLNIISPETIDLKSIYSFTVNPSDDLQYWTNKDYKERIKALNGYMTLYFLKQIPAECNLHMEFSRTGRLHFHGTIQFHSYESVRVFYLEVLHKLQGKFQLEIDTIQDMETWLNYCRKSKHLVDEELNTNKIQLKRLNGVKKNLCKDIQQDDLGSAKASPSNEEDKE